MGAFDPPGITQSRADARYPARWNVVSTSAGTYTASPNEWVRSSGAPAVITLPASPVAGDQVAVQRVGGSITVSVAGGSGHDINGQSTVGIAGIALPAVVYTYVGSGHWVMASTTGIMQFGLSVGAQGGFLIFGDTVSTQIAAQPGYATGTSYYAQGGDKNVFIDTASGVDTIVYAFANPDTSGTQVQGFQHTHWKNDTTATVTISCANGGTIDGAPSFSLAPGRAVELAVIQAPTNPAGTNLPAILEIVSAYAPPRRRTDPTGTLFATFDRGPLTGTPTAFPASGTGIMALVEVHRNCTVTNLKWRSGSTAAVTPTHQWAALKDLTGKVIAVTTDATTTAIPANLTQILALTTPTFVAAGVYYLELVVTASTMPTVTASLGGSTQLSTEPPIMVLYDPGRTTPPAVGATEALPGGVGQVLPYLWAT